MDQASGEQSSKPSVAQELVEVGKTAFDPSLDAEAREASIKKYNEFVDKTETWVLLPALNTLIKPKVLPSWLSEPFMQTLTLIPLRPDGVRGTMEFVFSVHPTNHSSQPADSSTPQKQGASITHEAVAVATRLLSSVPSYLTPEAWFKGIAPQLFHLIDGRDGSDLSRTAAQSVGFGILGKKQWGAPGAPGWYAFVQPLLEDLNPSLRIASLREDVDQEEVLDLSRGQVLTSTQRLYDSSKRLKVLVLANPSPGLCRRLLKPVLLQLWALATKVELQSSDDPVGSSRVLLETYLRLFGNSETIHLFLSNLLCVGSAPGEDRRWEYQGSQTQGNIEAVTTPATRGMDSEGLDWAEVERRAITIVRMMVESCTTENVSGVFLTLLRRWIKNSSKQGGTDIQLIQSEDEQEDGRSPLQDLCEVTVLQKLMAEAPEKLVGHFDRLLELICEVFKADQQTRVGDDLLGVVLSLLNLVITAPTFKKTDINPDELGLVEASLERLSNEDRADLTQTASNLALLLKYRGDMDDDESNATSAPSARQVEDRRTYNLAMNYITGTDNPPPVVSEGLNMLSGMIVSESSILDVTAVTVLMSKLLSNNEDYINLRVVKIFTQLASKHPRSTVKELLEHYLDAQEKASTDTRLRFGEALLQVVERLGETFSGDVASQVSETLLSIAGRRGYRPKAHATRAREERLEELKRRKEGNQSGGGEEPNVDDEEEMTEQEKVNHDILTQIVQGWDSKRGAEDVRMRSSALSLFGTALETNIAGVGSTLASGGVDLCINILTLEPELEKGILRRAAIVAVLGFVRALQQARENKRSLGFGLTDSSRHDISRTLEYVAATDNDGLVKQHARDVIESLENWHASSILPIGAEEEPPGLGRLAGLNVNPGGTLVDAAGRPRPRIEEVE